MKAISIKASAAEYARYWQRWEQGFVSGLAAPDRAIRLAALVGASRYFKVARNFAREYDIERGHARLDPALSILDEYRAVDVTPVTLIGVVAELRKRLASAYEMSDLLSAATKFLWLVHRAPVVIYDGNVRDALGAPSGDYATYCSRWHERYAGFKDAIGSETVSLASASGLPANTEWFRGRVFDIHMWNSGGTNA